MTKLFSLALVLSAVTSMTAAQPTRVPLAPGARFGIVLPPASKSLDGQAPASKPKLQLAMQALEVGLRRYGYEVQTQQQVVLQLLDQELQCEAHSCPARDVLRVLDLEAVALIAVWEDRSPADVTIQVTLPDGSVGEGRGRLDPGVDVTARVHGLLTDALADVKSGHPVPLRVDAIPQAASISLNGEAIDEGQVVHVPPGWHDVTATDPQLGTLSQRVQVPRGQTTPFVVPMVIPQRDRGDHLRRTEAPTRAWDYIAAAALAGIAVPLIASPVETLIDSGSCQRRVDEDATCQTLRFGTVSALSLAGGAALLGGAAYFLIATPIAASLITDGDSVHVQLNTTF